MKKILVVDDNEQNLYILKVLLEGYGYELATAKNGTEALDAAHSNIPDLIISDILMPVMDGFALCRQWKTDGQLKNIPFIFYTATYTDPKDEEFALSLGAERFIRKPTELDKFIEIVKNVLSEHVVGKSSEPHKPIKEEETYFKKYNEVLIHKMEDKMLELEQVNKRMSALFQASIDLTSFIPMTELIPRILKKVINVMGCTYGNYFEFDEDKKEFHLQMAVGFSEKDLVKHRRELIFHLGEARGLVGLVGQTREPLIIDDTLSDPRWIKADSSINSALFLPMVCEERLIGVLSILNTEVGSFNNENLRDMATLANILAVAIEKTRLFEKIKLSEESLRESEKFLDSVIENIPDMIFVKDAQELRFVRFNKAGEKLLGFSKPDLYGKNDYDFFPPVEAKYFTQKDKETLRKKQLIDIPEETILTKDKGERILHTKKIPILDEKGNPKYLLGISEDITERKLALEALRESRERFSSAFEFASIGMSLVGIDGNYLQVNHTFCEIVGYSEKEMLQKNFQEITHPDDLKADLDYVHQMLAGEITTYQMEKRYIHKLGHIIWILLSVSLIHDKDGNPLYFLSQIQDITKSKRSEKLLDTLNQAAVSMLTAETLEEVFTSVSNQLKKLNLACMLFPIDQSRNKLITKYMTFNSTMLNEAESMVGIGHESFSFSIDALDVYKQVIGKKKTVYQENTTTLLRQVIPAPFKKFALHITRMLNIPKFIVSPLTVRNIVLGAFIVLSKDLSEEDVPAITAFSNQLAAAWRKTQLIQNLKTSLQERDQAQTELKANFGRIQKSLVDTINAMTSIVEKRDPYTAGHQTRVTQLAIAIANELHLSADKINAIKTSGLVHDIGKINVPAEILSKPGKLTKNEFRLLKSHPKDGFDILKKIDFPWPVAEIVYQHHERINGTGYPRHLKGNKICIEAKILAVADVVEAMHSHRPYRSALSLKKTLGEIIGNKNSLYDEKVVKACVKIFKTGKFKF